MGFMIYRADTDKFLSDDNVTWVERDCAYSWAKRDSAENMLKNLRDKDCAQVVADIITTEEARDLSEKLDDVVEVLSKIESLVFYYAAEESKINQEQEDILHRIELGPIHGIVGVRLLKRLKKVRLERREIKDKLLLCNALRGEEADKMVLNYLGQKKGLSKRQYTARRLPELFK